MKPTSWAVVAVCLLVAACAGIGAEKSADAKKDHWSYRPLVSPPVPHVKDVDWVRNPIDAFVLAKLDATGLKPSDEADRRTLIRRVSFDLTGLPPTPDDVKVFVEDPRSDAYEKLVDRLLASPRYGERWARHWIDVVHFAETHGHEHDVVRPNAWPYRDYLIRSFNDDKPYARFVEEQIAGDALYPNDPQATVALGFLGAGPWDESSQMTIVDDTVDKLSAQNLDRDDILTTTMSTFASATVHCARCHDHKFDPVSQSEYYNLQACFAGIERAQRPYDADPGVHGTRQALLKRRTQLSAMTEESGRAAGMLGPAMTAQVQQWEQSLSSPAAEAMWTVLRPAEFTAAKGTVLKPMGDGSLLATGERPDLETYTITVHTEQQGITAVRVEALTDDSLPKRGPGRADNGNFHLMGLRLWASPKSGGIPPARVELQNASADFEEQSWTASKAIDSDPKTGWGIHPSEGNSHFAVFETNKPVGFAGGTTLKFELSGDDRKHSIGRVRVSVTTQPQPVRAKPVPDDVLAIVAVPAAQRTDAQRVKLAVHVLTHELDEQLATLGPPAMVYAGTTDFPKDGNFTPPRGVRPVFMLKRGDVTQPGAPAVPGGLSCVPELNATFTLSTSADEADRRAALARWLTDPKNVLTWRSIVNRTWHYHFGRGICDTPNDLGLMGGVPSHAELLDWLAVWFRDDAKGSLKALHRLMLTSSAYRQSSKNNSQYAKIDADNRLLWRMNRTRLDAEGVRDAVLQISGKIDLTMGGPSVKQFIMTKGIAQTPDLDYLGFDADDPANFRRSIYRFLYRTLPDPFMESMDCPDLSQWTPVRATSVTALQALAMLNDKFIVRQCEHVAERATKMSPQTAGQIDAIYQLALNRSAMPKEIELLSAYAERHGLANVCRLVLNSNEFMFVN